ncbi:MAG: hypothetical protein RLZZ311_916, partial [Actinomycetota bacterium]
MRMFKLHRSLSLFALLSILLHFAPGASADGIPETFTFTGSGYGHGVGMSQIGAKAMAVAGESATSILKYYYKDVAVIPVVDTATIRVNIAHAVKGATFATNSTDTSLIAFKGDLAQNDSLTAPLLTLGNKKKLILSISTDKKGIQGLPGTPSSATIRWSGGVTPVITLT